MKEIDFYPMVEAVAFCAVALFMFGTSRYRYLDNEDIRYIRGFITGYHFCHESGTINITEGL